MGPALQSAATFLKRKQTATSALAKALLAPDEMRLREQLEALGTTLDAERTSLLGRLPTFDTRLSTGDTTALADLQILQARLAYFSKWQAQIREAFLSLM
jgi:hypothetical protein